MVLNYVYDASNIYVFVVSTETHNTIINKQTGFYTLHTICWSTHAHVCVSLSLSIYNYLLCIYDMILV